MSKKVRNFIILWMGLKTYINYIQWFWSTWYDTTPLILVIDSDYKIPEDNRDIVIWWQWPYLRMHEINISYNYAYLDVTFFNFRHLLLLNCNEILDPSIVSNFVVVVILFSLNLKYIFNHFIYFDFDLLISIIIFQFNFYSSSMMILISVIWLIMSR